MKPSACAARNLADAGVLQTPMEVQRAFQTRLLSLVLADKVSRFTAEQQAEVAKAIRAGQDPKAVVAKFLPATPTKKPTCANALAVFHNLLVQGLRQLDPYLHAVKPLQLVMMRADLQRVRAVLTKLLELGGGDQRSAPLANSDEEE